MLSEDPLAGAANIDPAALPPTPNLQTLSIPAEAMSDDQSALLFAPIHPPASSPAPPDLSLPDLPYDSASSQPASPTPTSSQKPATERSETPQGSSDTPMIHAMLVDRDTPTTLNAQDNLASPAGQQEPPSATQGEVDTEPEQTSMRDHLAESEEYQSALTTGQPNPTNPLDRFMNEDMPLVHDAHPAAIFDHIDLGTIEQWDGFPTYKLIAIPFGFEARQHPKHKGIQKRILAAIAEITNSHRAGVSAPGPEDRVIRSRRRTPYAFLIHGLTKEQYQTLLLQRIWVSVDTTFRIATTKPTCPDLLFTITELSTLDSDAVYQTVLTTWSKETTCTAIKEVIEKNLSDSSPDAIPNIKGFLASLIVECLRIKEDKARLSPHYNIYANGRYFQNHKLWSQVRRLLANLTYGNCMIGSGFVKVAAFHCTICHGADHPRGLCPFPKIAGWRGPLGLAENDGGNPPHQFR